MYLGRHLVRTIKKIISYLHPDYHPVIKSVNSDSPIAKYVNSDESEYLAITVDEAETDKCFRLIHGSTTTNHDYDTIIELHLNFLASTSTIILSNSDTDEEYPFVPDFAYSSTKALPKLGKFAKTIENSLINRYLNTENCQNESGFELIYLYVSELHGLPDQEIVFSQEFDIKRSSTGNKIIITHNQATDSPPPISFFGPNISNIYALIGKNGSGKSSVFELIANCPIFNSRRQDNSTGKYFLIYRSQNHYLYFQEGLSYSVESDPDINFYEYESTEDISLIKISNIFDSIEFAKKEISKNSGDLFDSNPDDGRISSDTVIDLTTFTLMCRTDNWEEYLEEEKIRFENYYQFFRHTIDKKSASNSDAIGIMHSEDGTSPLSSGERARLTIFSRLLSVFYRSRNAKKLLGEIPNSKYYILMLDEAELYFHPEWQRTFIHDLICFFNILKTKKPNSFEKIIILLSSNSPFYMSDLPAQSICTMNQGKLSQYTFGQNIYSILKNKFFMENGVIGAFANQKIIDSFEFLVSEKEGNTSTKVSQIAKDFKYREIEYLISIIGDPLRKEQLSMLYREVKGNTIKQ